MTPEELGRVVHAKHKEGALLADCPYVVEPWENLRDNERACYIAQAKAVVAAYLASRPRARDAPLMNYAQLTRDRIIALPELLAPCAVGPCAMTPLASCLCDEDTEPTPALVAMMRGEPDWWRGDEGDCTAYTPDAPPPAPRVGLNCCHPCQAECQDNYVSPMMRAMFAAVSVGIPLYAIRPSPAPPCERSHGRCGGGIVEA